MSVARPRVMVVEDEDLARERLARLVGADAGFELVAACRNGDEALAIVQAEHVEVALLDIQMPGIDGMQLLRRMSCAAVPPLVVFITAHPVFAVDAFAGEAVDYVLKPFDGARLRKALRVAQERLRAREAVEMTQRIRSVINDVAAAPSQDADAARTGRLDSSQRQGLPGAQRGEALPGQWTAVRAGAALARQFHSRQPQRTRQCRPHRRIARDVQG